VSDRIPQEIYEFGRWKIDVTRRDLRAHDVPVPIGGRAFDILEVLLRSGGNLVTNDDLMNRVWPGGIVGENTLQVHMSAIRRAFGPDRNILTTISGRGYRLLGQWTPRSRTAPVDPAVVLPARPVPGPTRSGNLPLISSELFGRIPELRQVEDLLSVSRMITLTGTGGIGKTRLAIEVARNLLAEFGGDVWFLELAPLSDASLIPSIVAAGLQLSMVLGSISVASIANAIGDRRLLLIIDNCEHIIEAAAELAEAILRGCPRAVIIATSREILRIDGEHVVRVRPLDVPPPDQYRPDILLGQSALQLFVARACATSSEFSLHASDLDAVAEICRRLDGIPLAIEFAAPCAATIGVDRVLSLLDDRFTLLIRGRRTVLPRHRTLRATLDWSYELLPDEERRVLNALAVFVGGFTFDAAAAVVGGASSVLPILEESIANLARKSLIALHGAVTPTRWVLLETVRAYALEKLLESGVARETVRRHASYYRDLLVRTGHESHQTTTGSVGYYVQEIHNVHAAIDWAFSQDGDIALGVSLTANFAPVWLQASLMSECQHCVERALDALSSDDRDSNLHDELLLFSALGSALINTVGHGPEAQAAWERALARAERLGDIDNSLCVLARLWSNQLTVGEFGQALALADKYRHLVSRGTNPVDHLVVDRMAAFSLHFQGDQTNARQHLERMLASFECAADQSHILRFHFALDITARIRLAVILWLQGFPDRAMQIVEESVTDAITSGSINTLVGTLAHGALRIALANGDLSAAERFVTMLVNYVTKHEFKGYQGIAQCCRGVLLVKRDELDGGVRVLHDTLSDPVVARWALWVPGFQCDLAEAYSLAGSTELGLATIEDALGRTEGLGQKWCLAELLRLKGWLTLQRGAPEDCAVAVSLLRRSIDIARDQGTLSWELRAATTLAKIWRGLQRTQEAREVLAPVYDRFTEGFATVDLLAARTLLDQLG
jgi:predicted ATPase/DNA-binding winged helix-turn-helix (wHTH) protein